MIDTITIRIHDLNTHRRCVDIIEGLSKGGVTKYRREETEETTGTIEQRKYFSDFLLFHESGNVKEVYKSGSLNSSHHYKIKYFIEYQSDFINFEFSVPKYLYGTNIILFTEHFGSRNFSLEKNSNLTTAFETAYLNFLKFLKNFFVSLFGEIPISQHLTEIRRIDLCFNQVFPTKEDAFEYLKEIKRIRKKYSRETSNISPRNTSFDFVSKDYSFKIYHKGSEYKKHDRKRHKEINLVAPGSFDIDYLQGFADRILRYEMTIRNAYMSYVIDHERFRKQCPIFQSGRKLFQQKENAEKRGKFLELNAEQKRHIRIYKHHTNTVKNMMFQVQEHEKPRLSNTPQAELTARKIDRILAYPFDEKTFALLAARFLQQIENYKLKQRIDNAEIVNRFRIKNSRKELLQDAMLPTAGVSKVYLGKIQMVLNLMESNNMTLDDLKTCGLLNERTYYRVQAKFKEIGIDTRNILPTTTPNPSNLRPYHQEIIENPQKFFRINYL